MTNVFFQQNCQSIVHRHDTLQAVGKIELFEKFDMVLKHLAHNKKSKLPRSTVVPTIKTMETDVTFENSMLLFAWETIYIELMCGNLLHNVKPRVMFWLDVIIAKSLFGQIVVCAL